MLSKSDIQSFLQCPRKLWLEHHRRDLVPTEKEDPVRYRRAVDGRIVSERARAALGPDFVWPPGGDDYGVAAERAKALLGEAAGKPAAEFPMVHGEIYARADALVPEDRAYVLRETKASTFPLKKDKVTPDAPDDHHLSDVAVQAWVMEASGLPMARVELNLLNNQWRYPGNGDYAGLFRQMDVTAAVRALKESVPAWIAEAEAVLAGDMPKLQTGRQCKEPYPCPFISHCEALDEPAPEHPIDLLPDSAGKKLASKLREQKGYTSLLEPKPEELTGAQAALYRRIQAAHRTGEAVLESGADKALEAYAYPRYYLDFEAIDFPVPRWQGIRPYEQVPFQWSCHIERARGRFEHGEFLDLSGEDPSRACILKMLRVIDPNDNGPIFVYHRTFEEGRLREFAVRHPEHAEALQVYLSRLVDLLPLVKNHFYHPQMRGSFSIKKVLPVIAPELSYEHRDEIQEGTAAQVAYLRLLFETGMAPEERIKLESELRDYCRHDTWAMVEVAWFLTGAGRPVRPEGM
jgi:hypothetical protein